MGRRLAVLLLVTSFLVTLGAPPLFSQEKEIKTEAISPIAAINNSENWEGALSEGEKAINACRSYDDYEKLASEIKKAILREKDSKYPDILQYLCAKARVRELSYLTKKNDIDSGRIYMSVSEKYYNEALACLDKASQMTKSKDLGLGICFLKFLVYKEMFQPEKMDTAFNEMIEKIASYTAETPKNVSKLNEVSQLFTDEGLGDYAMKLKLLYASKVDPDSARMIANDIKAAADSYFDSGHPKEALSTYDTYLDLAENYYDKDAFAPKIMDVAERYFNKAYYKEAVKYYSMYLFKYSNSLVADYCSYKLGMSLYFNKEYKKAIEKLEEFLNIYSNSVWFEKAFESLCKLYYENMDTAAASEALQKIADKYPRRDSRDYAYLLMGILRYSDAEYNKSAEMLKKIESDFPKSVYIYPAGELIRDIDEIKKGAVPSHSFGSKDLYKVWEPYTNINCDISASEGAQAIENKDSKPGEIFIKAAPGSKITFNMTVPEDMDRFNEYMQDKDDQSRLPRKVRDETEKDLIFFSWSGPEGGKFMDDRQALSRVWQAPAEPGNYTMTVNIGDLALVRQPDAGTRKDPAKTLAVHISIEK
ncbi:MAG: outer membrane protein assembly factor BamD [Candidatus Omnitrophota bacterium]|nr:outer membrane protein assembly factor BamD [Candidatus Omnitrophota bacterium]